MNLLSVRECVTCGGDKDETWDKVDRKRVVWRIPDDPESPQRIIGFSDR